MKPKQQRESGLGCAGREIKKRLREREREGERVGHWVRIASELRVQHIHIIMASTERLFSVSVTLSLSLSLSFSLSFSFSLSSIKVALPSGCRIYPTALTYLSYCSLRILSSLLLLLFLLLSLSHSLALLFPLHLVLHQANLHTVTCAS